MAPKIFAPVSRLQRGARTKKNTAEAVSIERDLMV
jgi:hypothetical protein